MSLIILRTFQDGDYAFYGIAHYEGQIVENGGVGKGDSERAAATSALNSLFRRRELDERPESAFIAPATSPAAPPHPADEWAAKDAYGDPLPKEDFGLSDDIFTQQDQIYDTYRAILTALEDWLAGDRKQKVLLHYRDKRDNYTEREVLPTKIDLKQAAARPFLAGGAMLEAIDVGKDEPRHFRVDGIEKLVIR